MVSVADTRSVDCDHDGSADVQYPEYGCTDPLTVTRTPILNQEAGLGWTTSGRTALPAP